MVALNAVNEEKEDQGSYEELGRDSSDENSYEQLRVEKMERNNSVIRH